MKITIDLEKGETQDQVDEALEKALRGKKKIIEEMKERYSDPVLNEFHDKILKDHLDVLEDIKDRISAEVKALVSPK